MTRLILRRLLALIPTLLIVTFAVFMLTSLVPGDPAVTLAGGTDANPARIEQIRDELHLDEPLVTRYVQWLGDTVRFDFGNALISDRPIVKDIKSRLPITLSLVLAGGVIALVLGVPLGLAAGFSPGGMLDRLSRVFASLSAAIPSFLLGPLLIVYLAVRNRWLPTAGYVNFGDSTVEWAKHLVLPGLAIGLMLGASLARQLRGALVDTLSTNYVRTLWATGARRRRVLMVHGLRNAAGPALTLFALQLGALIGGTVVIEKVFGLQGLGAYILDSVIGRDLPVVQAVTVMFVVIQAVVSLGIDLSHGFLNPKVRDR